MTEKRKDNLGSVTHSADIGDGVATVVADFRIQADGFSRCLIDVWA